MRLQDIFSGSTHLSDSSSLILERVDRHHAGIYQCAADNGVKDPVSMDIHLTILCKPANLSIAYRASLYDGAQLHHQLRAASIKYPIHPEL